MGLFSSKKTSVSSLGEGDFSYLRPGEYYFDTTCQSLRPNQVIAAETAYYHEFNSCGHRVKYPWGEKTDAVIRSCREALLDLVGKRSKEYAVAFGINTTSGINAVLHQMDPKRLGIRRVVTSEIEHNSVFLPTMVFARRHGLSRTVLKRSVDPSTYGALLYEQKDLDGAVVVVNTMSNIDGQELQNLSQLARDVRAGGGYLLLDACQSFAHHPEHLRDIDADAIFGSGHKMYGPSVGFVIIKKQLLRSLDYVFIGGGTVQDVQRDEFTLIQNDDELEALLEPGLQNYAGIVGLEAAIRWRKDARQNDREQELIKTLFTALNDVPNIHILNPFPSPIVSFYSEKMDAHKIATFLGQAGIMCRSGYFCCHYFLREVRNLPPLVRVSLGLHNTSEDIATLKEKLSILLR